MPWALIRSRTMSWEKKTGFPRLRNGLPRNAVFPNGPSKPWPENGPLKTVSIAHYIGGSYIRVPTPMNPPDWKCILLGMQGLGEPGSPSDARSLYFGHAQGGWAIKDDLLVINAVPIGCGQCLDRPLPCSTCSQDGSWRPNKHYSQDPNSGGYLQSSS